MEESVQKKEILFKCAEGIIYKKHNYKYKDTVIDEVIVKERVKKSYRIPELEKHLSQTRMKQEVNNLAKAKKYGIPVPIVYYADFSSKKIYMEYFKDQISLKAYLKRNSKFTDYIGLRFQYLGKVVAQLHNHELIHGDLTSSNILVNCQEKCHLLNLIDFGLSFTSNNVEDKAVDLYVFDKSLLCEENSNQILKNCLKSFYEGYSKNSNDS